MNSRMGGEPVYAQRREGEHRLAGVQCGAPTGRLTHEVVVVAVVAFQWWPREAWDPVSADVLRADLARFVT